MDRSVDSIGSCSLDVDAESTDISETSSCFPTPTMQKDFTSNIQNRCTDSNSKHNSGMILTTQPKSNKIEAHTTLTATLVDDGNHDGNKIPSYLNLACCVNGYSNLTTYDSKIRQDINKSREVSPIRPSTNCIQYCKKSNSLAPPVLLKMSDEEKNTKHASTNDQHKSALVNNCCNGKEDHDDNKPSVSFIQQRVERLYGPDALVQGLYSPRRTRSSPMSQLKNVKNDTKNNEDETPELFQKFKQLSPCKEYRNLHKKNVANSPITNTTTTTTTTAITAVANNKEDEIDFSLPVFRHLSQEFRAQLSANSPKRNQNQFTEPTEVAATQTAATAACNNIQPDEVDHKTNYSKDIKDVVSQKEILEIKPSPVVVENKKDGQFFLVTLKKEQTRLLSLADEVEKYIEESTENTEISEEVLGFLRAASGKARLLVSQKMKQFEGLCNMNLKHSPEEKYYTTVDDLQGFWDMVSLQVEQVDSLFAEIRLLKANNWKKNEPDTLSPVNKIKPKKTVNTKATATATNGSKSTINNGTNATMSAAALKRENQRKQLMEMKRKQKLAMATATATATAYENAENNSNGGAVGGVNGNEASNTIEIFVKSNKKTNEGTS